MTRTIDHLSQRRDGLLREAEYLQKRLGQIHEEVTALNAQIVPYLGHLFPDTGADRRKRA